MAVILGVKEKVEGVKAVGVGRSEGEDIRVPISQQNVKH